MLLGTAALLSMHLYERDLLHRLKVERTSLCLGAPAHWSENCFL